MQNVVDSQKQNDPDSSSDKAPVKNNYVVCLGGERPPISWDPRDTEQKINLHTDYFGKAFVAMEKYLDGGGWTIYLTWDLKQLPSYGENVIAVILGDEFARIPLYAHKVQAVFKCYGAGPHLGCNPLRKPTYQNWLTLLRHVNNIIQFTPGWLNWHLLSISATNKGSLEQKIYPIPLGYANQVEVSAVPFEERPYDISFAGSVVHKPYKWWSPRKWFKTPKSYSRSRMVAALKQVKKSLPGLNVDLKITSSYREIRSADPIDYSERVMNTKISIVPRGASYETYRFFEAIRFGCIVIAEYLPPFWFYGEAPVYRIDDWGDLDTLVSELTEDPKKLQEVHYKTLQWWKTVCSEEALAAYMASKINELQSQST